MLREVGCGSSVIGAILFGVALPWAAFRDGFVYDGAPSVVVVPLAVLFMIVVGGMVGAVLVPAFVLSVYWIV